MLSALLPGVRDFRTPLLTGLLWLACAWLVCGMPIAESSATDDFVSSFGLEALPKAAWFAAMALVAYLVGSLLVVRTSPFTRISDRYRWRAVRAAQRLEEDRAPAKKRYNWIWTWWNKNSHRGGVFRPLRRLHTYFAVEVDSYESIDFWLNERFNVLVDQGLVPLMRGYGDCSGPTGFEALYDATTLNIGDFERRHRLQQAFASVVKQEKTQVEARIQMRHPDVYAEIDRHRVESELRMSIFWPLVLLIVLLAFAWSPLALLALPVPPLLVWDAFHRSTQATDKTWGVLMSGEVTTPVLDAIAEACSGPVRPGGDVSDLSL